MRCMAGMIHDVIHRTQSKKKGWGKKAIKEEYNVCAGAQRERACRIPFFIGCAAYGVLGGPVGSQ